MFSVVVPVYNKAPHLNRSIDSILNQTYTEFELIVIDDASTDGSSEKLSEFNDPRIRILKRNEPGPGGYAARNLGIQASRFDWVSFIDADDKWEPHYLESVAEALDKYKDVDIISTNWDNRYDDRIVTNRFFEKFTEPFVEFTLKDFFQQNFFIWTSAVTIKKRLLIESGLFPESRCKRGGDIDTWIRCLNDSNQNIWINKRLAHYYKETVNRVTDNSTNPVVDICAVDSIEKIRSASDDNHLLKSIDKFLSNIIYNKMISDYRLGLKPSFKDLNLVRNGFLRAKIRTKYLLRVYLFEKRH